ncbi:hypothetical protein, partial [Pseudomonas sp. BF-RE-01]|uniref:hypothetical protein n=1 Tax=Pseudomonas sp. BF-RE-01 TaxID=2832361 RepID=UPI003988F547
LAMGPVGFASISRPPSPASRLLQGFGDRHENVNNTIHCRSRLAGDEARWFYIDFKAAIAGKPTPTGL